MSKMSKQVVEVLTVLHALISDALGVSHDGGGDEQSILDDLSDDDLKKLAKNLDLATPRQLARMGREKLLVLFEDVDDEVIRENLNDPDGDSDDDPDDGEAVVEFLTEQGYKVGDLRDLAVKLKIMKKAEAAGKYAKSLRTAIAEKSTLEEVQEAVGYDPDGDSDDDPDDGEAVTEFLTEQKLAIGDLRVLAVELKAVKKTAAAQTRSKKDLIQAIAEKSTLEEVQEVLSSDDSEEQEKDDLLSACSIGDLRVLAEGFGLASAKKLSTIKSKKDLVAMFADVPLEEILENVNVDGGEGKDSSPPPRRNQGDGEKDNKKDKKNKKKKDKKNKKDKSGGRRGVDDDSGEDAEWG